MIEFTLLEFVLLVMWLITMGMWAKALHRSHVSETVLRAMMENKTMRDRMVESYEALMEKAK